MKLKSILTFVVAILVSFGLVITSYVIFNPIKVEKENKIILEKIQNVMSDAVSFELNASESINSTEILVSARVFGKDKAELGYYYEINEKNGFGNIKLIVAADAKNVITKTEVVELNQTMYQSQSEKLIKAYVNQKLTNIVDLNAGATSVSLNTIMKMFKNLSEHHAKVPQFENKPPYFEFFGEDYEIVSTETKTINEATIKIEEVKGKGFVYSVTKAGFYYNESDTKKPITLVIGLDTDGKILGADLPLEVYEHTVGFRPIALQYAQSFTNTNLVDFVDAYAGATSDDGTPNNTNKLIHELYVLAKEVYLA